MRATLQAIKAKLRQRMHEPVNAVGAWLKRVVSGYYRYHAVPDNQRAYVALPRSVVRSVAVDAWPSQSAQPSELEAHSPDLRTMDTSSSYPASLSRACVLTPLIQGRSRVR